MFFIDIYVHKNTKNKSKCMIIYHRYMKSSDGFSFLFWPLLQLPIWPPYISYKTALRTYFSLQWVIVFLDVDFGNRQSYIRQSHLIPMSNFRFYQNGRQLKNAKTIFFRKLCQKDLRDVLIDIISSYTWMRTKCF